MEKETFRIEVSEKDQGKRVDKFLAEELSKKFSRTFIQKLISEGNVSLNGAAVKRGHRLKASETIEVNIPEPQPTSIKAEDIPLEVVYEDEYVIVVNKPIDLVTHPAPGNYSGTLVNALLWHCKNLSGIGGVLKPGIVHRLDKGTSGLIVAAKRDEAHRDLARQFKEKSVKKIYVALVKGIVELDNGIVELPIGRSGRDRKKMVVRFEKGKVAKTRYKVLKRFKDFTLLEITLDTGRTHQIRVHASYIGHPILGDEKYGTKGHLSRPALHASVLGFVHPATKKYVEFKSELPSDMNRLISRGHL